MRKAGLKGGQVALDPSGFEQLAFWITALAPLLLLGGIIGAYLEFKIPGASLPGIFAGGDCIRSKGAASTVMAVQDGKLAARSIDERLVAHG